MIDRARNPDHRALRAAWARAEGGRRLRARLGRLALLVIAVAAWETATRTQNWSHVLETTRVGLPFTARELPVPEWFVVAGDMIARAAPPDLAYLADLVRPAWETIVIATLGTIVAVAIATPLAFLAARNTTPHRAVRGLVLLLVVSSRSINSLIWALLFVRVLGPGPIAGLAASAVRSIGFVAKLVYEAIEESDPAPVRAVRATGATRLSSVLYAIVPQVKPTWIGTSLFRWDINVRESAVVGYVGAGGLGMQLRAMTSENAWDRVVVILLVVLAMTLVAEWVSARTRAAAT